MKRILTIAVVAVLLCGCGSADSKKAGKVAEKFLTAFFQMDYETAGALCAGDLASEIIGTIEDVEMPSEEMATLIREASLNTTFEISSVDTKTEKGVATVIYNVIPYGSPAVMERSMILIKDSGKWLVFQLL